MINKWILEHFKSVNEKITLQFAPLTVFAGANSSGKSTVIQSILLTTQTIQSQVHSRPVVLNGHIVRLGTFNDIISNQAKLPNISIGFELLPTLRLNDPLISQRRYYGRFFHDDFLEILKSINCIYSFSASGNKSEKDILQLQPRLESCVILTHCTHEEKDFDEKVEIQRTKIEITDRIKKLRIESASTLKVDVSGLEYEVVSKPVTPRRIRHYMGMPNTGEVVGSNLQHFLPSRFIMVYDVVEEQSRRMLDVLFNPEHARYNEISPTEMPLLSNDFAANIITMLEASISAIPSSEVPAKRLESVMDSFTNLKKEFTPKSLSKIYRLLPTQIQREFFHRIDEKAAELRKMLKAGRQSEYNLAYIPMSEFSDGAAEFVQAFFANRLKYLGPLRDEPKPVYPLAGSVDPKDIGFKGENTAAVLEIHRKIQIQYIPCSVFSTLNSAFISQLTTLEEAVLDWLEYLGVAHGIKTFDKGKLGHELKVSTLGSESLHDLTHVGVGVSQVLPILVQSLLSEPGSTLIFEQPELHLHPKVQTRLADFFVSMTMIGKQCIIETHSEYMINRLRYMAAVTEGEQIANDVILYFVEKEEGCSEYRPIHINKYGVIEDWPQGFFDENEENAAETLKAGMQKKLKEKNKRKEL